MIITDSIYDLIRGIWNYFYSVSIKGIIEYFMHRIFSRTRRFAPWGSPIVLYRVSSIGVAVYFILLEEILLALQSMEFSFVAACCKYCNDFVCMSCTETFSPPFLPQMKSPFNYIPRD